MEAIALKNNFVLANRVEDAQFTETNQSRVYQLINPESMC